LITVTDVDGGAPSFAVLTAPANGTLVVRADGTYTYTPALNYNGTDSFEIEVTDGNGGSTTIIIPVTITPVNDGPVLVTPAPDRFSDEDQAFSFAVPPANFMDVDGPSLTLSATLASGAALPAWVVFNAATGGFTGTPPLNFNGFLDIKVTASDGTLTAEDTFRLTITPVNDAPVSANGSLATNEDMLFSGTLPAATDVDGDTLVYAAGGISAAHGTVIINANGTFSYQPDANYNGVDSFTFTVNDGTVTIEYTMSVTVTAVNDAPVATNNSATTDEDTLININVLGDDTDIDGDTLSITHIDGQAIAVNGSVAVTGGSIRLNADNTLTFTPTLNYNGAPSFSYAISDGNGGASTATVNLTVNAINDTPVLTTPIPDATFAEDQPVSITIAAGTFTDVDGPAAIYTATLAGGAALPAWLVFTPATQSFSGTPPLNFNGFLDITVRASDGSLFAQDDFRLTITPVNDAPVAADDAFSTNEDTQFNGTLPVATDVDGDALTYAAGGTAPTHGAVIINANGTFSYQPALNYNGTDSFTYTVTDGGIIVEKTITVTVNAVNDAPVVTTPVPNQNVAEDTLWTYVVPAATFTDLDSALTYSATLDSGAALPAWLAFNAATRTFSGTPPQDFNGVIGLRVTASDGVLSVFDDFTLTVNPVNDAPTAVSPAIVTNEDTAFIGSVTAADIDGDALSYATNTAPAHGTLVVRADGTYTYTPTLNYNGTDSFSITVSDGNGGQVVVTIPVTVTAINDAPVTMVDTIVTAEDTPITFDPRSNDSDIENDALTITEVDGQVLVTGTPVPVTGGSITRLADGTLTFTPTLNYNGTPSFTYTLSDSNGGTASSTVNLTVNPVNDAPTAVSPAIVTNEDTAFIGSVTAADIDGDALSYATNTAPAHGTLVVRADGTYTYTPTLNYNGADSFSITVSDGNGGQVVVTIPVTVTAVNDAPTVVNDSVTTAEDTPIIFDPRLNDSDIEGDALTITHADGQLLVTGTPVPVSGGTITRGADGRLTFTPTGGYSGTSSITYTATDGNGGSTTGTVSLIVTLVNDAPVASSPPVSVSEDSSVNGIVTASDIDGDALTYAVNTAPANGTLVVRPDGTYTYTPNANYNGADSFSITVSDGNGGQVVVTIPVTVTAVNDAPATLSETIVTQEGATVSFDPRSNDTDVDGDALTVTEIDGRALTTGLPLAITGGSITRNFDGTLTFTPDAGFIGAPSFTYTLSDSNGGTATGTVFLQVTAASGVNTIEPVTVPFGTPAVLSNNENTQREEGLRTFSTNGIILDSLNAISPLSGNFVPFAKERPLLTAINGISQLNPENQFGQTGRIVDPNIIGLGTGSSSFGDALIPYGLSNQGAFAGLDPRSFNSQIRETQLVINDSSYVKINMTVNNEAISLNFREFSVIEGTICRNWIDVRQLDGKPLPDWLRLVQEGEFSGTPPADVGSIDLHMTIRLDDGTEVMRAMRMDVKSGEMKPLSVQTELLKSDALFSQQLTQAVEGVNQSVENDTPYRSLL
ncbi:MAG: tandem-95 repeat protein, partial [Beijerinckiaceae bacterium]